MCAMDVVAVFSLIFAVIIIFAHTDAHKRTHNSFVELQCQKMIVCVEREKREFCLLFVVVVLLLFTLDVLGDFTNTESVDAANKSPSLCHHSWLSFSWRRRCCRRTARRTLRPSRRPTEFVRPFRWANVGGAAAGIRGVRRVPRPLADPKDKTRPGQADNINRRGRRRGRRRHLATGAIH